MASVSTDRRFGVNSGKAMKVACITASTANLTLSGEQTIDGISCVTDDRVLVKDQTDATENGIWIVDTGAWARSTDFDDIFDVGEGTLVHVSRGTVNAGRVYKISTTGTITPGTTSIAFAQALVSESSTVSFTQSGTGAVETDVETKLRENVSFEDFGAVGDNVTDDSTAIQKALDSGAKNIYGLDKTYYCASTLTVSTNGLAILGEGTNATIIRSGATGAAISINTGLTGVAIRNLQVTRTAGTAASGDDGIKFNTLTEQATIENVKLSRHWVGLSLCPTSYSYVKELLCTDNYSHGVLCANNATNAGLQWSFHKCLSQKNDGYGLYYDTTSGAAACSVGDIHLFSTFANKLGGAYFLGDAASPINAIRWFGGFIGSDGNHGLQLDTYGSSGHKIEGLFVEQIGVTACGVDLGTAATNVGQGIRITSNNTDVQLIGCLVIQNSYTGIFSAADFIAITGCECRINGNAAVGGEQNGVNINAGRAVITGNKIIGHANYGVFLNVDGHSVVGNDLSSNTTASVGSGAGVTGSHIAGNLGDTYSTLNSPIRIDNVQVVTNRITGWGAPTGTDTRTTFATSSVTLSELAERVKALIDDVTTHGLIGPST